VLFLLIFVFFFSFFSLYSQTDNQTNKPKGYLVYIEVINGDTLYKIYLKEIIVMPPRVFKSKREAIRYSKLVRNIKKVLPYAKIAKTRLMMIENELSKLTTEQEKKEYLKLAEKKLREEFEDEIKNLTFSQGKLLIKLIDREIGKSSYEIIKEFKGSFNAFLYQQLARLFGANLKEKYDPEFEDKYIEEIIIRIENGEL